MLGYFSMRCFKAVTNSIQCGEMNHVGVISCSDVGTKMFLLCHERDLFLGLLLKH